MKILQSYTKTEKIIVISAASLLVLLFVAVFVIMSIR